MAKHTAAAVRVCPVCRREPLRSYFGQCETCWVRQNSGLWILGKQLARGILGKPRGVGQGNRASLR